jgi:hypothetical protein
MRQATENWQQSPHCGLQLQQRREAHTLKQQQRRRCGRPHNSLQHDSPQPAPPGALVAPGRSCPNPCAHTTHSAPPTPQPCTTRVPRGGTRQQAPYLRPLSPTTAHRFHRNTHIRGGCLVVTPPSTRSLHPTTTTTGTHTSISCPVRPFHRLQQAAPLCATRYTTARLAEQRAAECGTFTGLVVNGIFQGCNPLY